ncbi:MAG: cardiolipin synthase [Planctomycetota bacterium]|jgi:cardiolipin synthase
MLLSMPRSISPLLEDPGLLEDRGWMAALAIATLVVLQVAFSGLVLLRPQRRQASSLAWILVILMLPVIGILAYLVFGEVRLGRGRRERHRRIQASTCAVLEDTWKQHRRVDLAPGYEPLHLLASSVGKTEPRGGNGVLLLGDAQQFLASLVADIQGAQEHCHLLYYIVVDDPHGQKVAEALLAAAARGVKCRLLCDALGSRLFLESDLAQRLRDGGVRVEAALPAWLLPLVTARIDMRNHRKLCVIDHSIGYTGSQNLAAPEFDLKPKFAPWVDCMLRIEGPAVLDLAQLFVEDWFLDTDEDLSGLLKHPQPTAGGVPLQVMGTGPNSRNEALVQLMQSMLHLAREEVHLTTPYFVPDEGTLDAITTAAARGVKVTLTVPRRGDSRLVGAASRSFYETLLAAGVEIREYRKGVLHSKLITVDRSVALVTTANLDRRSFEINFEASTLIYDSDLASQVRLLQLTYMNAADLIDAQTWVRRPIWRRALQNAAGLLGPLL